MPKVKVIQIEYMEPTYSSPRPANYVSRMGETLNVRVSWSIYDGPMGDRLRWFISDCAVQSFGLI